MSNLVSQSLSEVKLDEELSWKIYPMTAKPTVVTIIAMDACTHMLDRHSPIN